MSAFQDGRLVTATNGCSRLTVFAENQTTGITSIFSVKLSVPDEGFSYMTDTLEGKKRETQYNKFCDGTALGLGRGGTTYEEKTMDFTFGDDFNQVVNVVDPTVARNILKAMFEGTSFIYNSEVYICVSTSGTRYIGEFTTGLDTKYLLLQDGKVLDPNAKNVNSGSLVIKNNNYVTAYNETTCVMVEAKYAFDTQTVKGDRFVYYLAESCTFNEGSGADYNRYAISGTRYCDYRNISKYLVEGVSYPVAMATSGTDSLYEIECTHIIAVNGGGTPTVAGNSGDQIVVVDTADGTIELYKHDGTDFITTPVTSTVGEGCKIFAPLYDTALDGVTAVTKNVYVACKTAGTTGNAVASNWKTKATGSGSDTYVVDIYDWDYGTRDFVAYDGTEI